MLINWCPQEFHGNTTICGAQGIAWVRIESPLLPPLVIKLAFAGKRAEVDFSGKRADIAFTGKRAKITFAKVDC